MNYVRSLLYGIPLFLLLLFVVSFINTASLSTQKKNEMALGIQAEPVTLNPIQQTDASSGLVTGFLFNGLLKENENLELVGSLASDWSLSQVTTFYFHTSAQAERAKTLLEKEKDAHPEWSLLSMTLGKNRDELIITLQEPGYRIPNEISKLFSKETLIPIPTSDQETHLFKAEPIINFSLRHDVRWHDGVPLTSADVVFTWHAIMDDRVASPRRSDFELVSKIETPDPWHVIVHYQHPFSPALNSWTTLIIPAHILEKKDPSLWGGSFNRHPIGTGPFRFDTWKSNEYVRLKKNSDYFLGSPWLDSIVCRTLPDPLTLRLAFETHQIDFWDASAWAVKGCSEDPRFEVFAAPGNSYSYIGWNRRRPLFADVRVRRALAHAINIPAMIQYLLYGNGVPSTGIFTPRMWCFDPSVQPLSYDPQKAAALLDQAGWKVGPDGIRTREGKRFSFTLLTSNGSSVGSDIATLLQDDLKKMGIEMKIEVLEWTVFLKNVQDHHFDATVAAWALPDDCDQYAIWDSSQAFPGGFNYVGYNNPHVDTLLKEIRNEYARPELIRLAHELQETIYHDQPYLFLFVPKHTSVLWKGTYRMRYPTDHGFVDSPLTTSKAGWNYNMEWFYRTDYPPKQSNK